ncbi:GTP cyclohydrolase [Urechidicola vernalis]|uniref:GTP cyclohydrolase n=1 Tax=Urechidicola vernalis TaxID=3075600 RepID=A0ABU2Y801_9FLAO|nr:GTP cyclohydrolase [Urechidicola sp. P050]MDT0554316.1 GTP cyclohydrolase [Urechidicola sp. P050]
MILIKEVSSKKEMKAFVKFPFSLYKNHPYWVPPIINDELASLDKNINPVFKHAEVKFLLAYKSGKIVGRVAAIINWTEVNTQKISKMRFGWYDIIDDIEVSKALLNRVHEIGKNNNLEFVEGPVGFSNLDKVGVLIEGYDYLGTMITWYNHPYYVTHLETLGFKKEKQWLESIIEFKDIDPTKFTRFSKLISQRFELTAKRFTSTDELMPYVDEMFDLFNDTYKTLSSFVPISEDEKSYFKKKYIHLIDPNFIKFVMDKDDKMIAFAITLPSFSRALQKAKGKLYPFGIFHLLQARKKSDEIIFYLIGVNEKYQNKGVTAIIFDEFYKSCKARGIKRLIRTPELDENEAIHLLWKDFNPLIHKRRRTYRQDIS